MSSSKKPRPRLVSEESETRNWLDLPRDVTSSILKKLGTFETLTSAQWVCTQWWTICKDPLMWRTVDLRWPDGCVKLNVKQFENLIRHVIDRSCGHLEDIALHHFGDNDMLAYIVDSGCHLRRLRLSTCLGLLTEKGLCGVAKKLPWLEELDISYCFVSKDALQAIGQCCPLLKALKFNTNGSSRSYPTFENDKEAFAIAKTMPGLRHLALHGNGLTDDGLVAILDGCPHLESLDLMLCNNVAFRGNLRSRCAEQLKNVWYPCDSAYDNSFDDSEMDYGWLCDPSDSDSDTFNEALFIDYYTL